MKNVHCIMVVLLVGCAGVVEPEVEPEPETSSEARPTPPPASCPASYTCPSEYSNCSSWTTNQFCGADACTAGTCLYDDNPWTYGHFLPNWYAQYRVCANAQGQSCTSAQVTVSYTCAGPSEC